MIHTAVYFFCTLYRKAERQRAQTYQQELDEIKQRVKQRPLLFEQAAQVCFASESDSNLTLCYSQCSEHHHGKC